ncbi:MAG: hypothetical protein AAF585_23020 [Verrucomicrobiota bacterium]
MNRDLKNPKWIILKGFLFLLIGAMCIAGILIEHFEWRTAFLLAIGIWAFCRFYYFLFYVIEKYIDEEFKFSGLISAARYLIQRRKSP